MSVLVSICFPLSQCFAMSVVVIVFILVIRDWCLYVFAIDIMMGSGFPRLWYFHLSWDVTCDDNFHPEEEIDISVCLGMSVVMTLFAVNKRLISVFCLGMSVLMTFFLWARDWYLRLSGDVSYGDYIFLRAKKAWDVCQLWRQFSFEYQIDRFTHLGMSIRSHFFPLSLTLVLNCP